MRLPAIVLAAVLILAPLGARAADLVVWWEEGQAAEEDAGVRETVAAFEQKTGKQVELDVKTDPNLLGGFVAQIGSEIWDASVSGKIHKFRDSLT